MIIKERQGGVRLSHKQNKTKTHQRVKMFGKCCPIGWSAVGMEMERRIMSTLVLLDLSLSVPFASIQLFWGWWEVLWLLALEMSQAYICSMPSTKRRRKSREGVLIFDWWCHHYTDDNHLCHSLDSSILVRDKMQVDHLRLSSDKSLNWFDGRGILLFLVQVSKLLGVGIYLEQPNWSLLLDPALL